MTSSVCSPTIHPELLFPEFLTITAWNCRGLATACPYLHKLFECDSDIVILSEHWLWPFDLYKLESLHPSFFGFGCADRRLTDITHDRSRGYGGVGVLWRKSLDVFPISDIVFDRICGIKMKKDGETWLSIIGVSLPCADLGMDYYRDTLVDLEKIISDFTILGPVVVAGEFNAHLGKLWEPRASSTANCQGLLLGKLLNRCELHATSLSSTTSGQEGLNQWKVYQVVNLPLWRQVYHR